MPDAMPSPPAEVADEEVPFGRRLSMLASANPTGPAVTVVARDGAETLLTWDALERNANQWGRVLQSASVGHGAMVALSIPNSVELVVATLAAWKVGAIPVPMRWDLPDWEQRRLLQVIEPALVLDESNVAAMAKAARAEPDGALPGVVAPALNGICSSGSTGLPKIILNTAPAVWTPLTGVPFMAQWAP